MKKFTHFKNALKKYWDGDKDRRDNDGTMAYKQGGKAGNVNDAIVFERSKNNNGEYDDLIDWCNKHNTEGIKVKEDTNYYISHVNHIAWKYTNNTSKTPFDFIQSQMSIKSNNKEKTGKTRYIYL